MVMAVALTTQTLFAQVPSYVPTSGLVGYWPFNGNANDESGNGNNGVVSGAVLTADRFTNNSNAFSFNGSSSYITVPNSPSLNPSTSITLSWWCYVNQFTNTYSVFISNWDETNNQRAYSMVIEPTTNKLRLSYSSNGGSSDLFINSTTAVALNNWIHVVYVKSVSSTNIYINGVLINSTPSITGIYSSSSRPIRFGAKNTSNPYQFFNGKLDDIGIWNRSLTQQEITNLYNSVSSNECFTMVINTGVLSTNPVTYTSTVSIYPNPANDQITIDCGNLANVLGWNIKITNMLGQEVFNQPMNTQQYVLPLNSWTGQGMYFVKIINAQNEVVNIKKIILQ